MTESNSLESHRADRDLKAANAIRELLEREFPATDTPPRQRRIGRNVQLNIKATAEVVEREAAKRTSGLPRSHCRPCPRFAQVRAALAVLVAETSPGGTPWGAVGWRRVPGQILITPRVA